jgi:hypothetical protein
MASKAKSGLSAVRQFTEKWLEPPFTFTEGAAVFNTSVRDGKGHSALHVNALNNTAGTLLVLMSNRSGGPFVIVATQPTALDAESSLHSIDITVPMYRRFVKLRFVGTLGADFEMGAYFLPRADVFPLSTSGGGTGGSPVPNRSSFTTAQKDVTTAGTGEQLPSIAIPNGFAVVIKAKDTNGGRIQVGNSKANSESTSVSFSLGSNEFVRLFITNTNLVWIDSTADGEGVEIIVEQ